jgi:futalosine hydrolase
MMNEERSRILIMTAVAAERDAVVSGLRGHSRFGVVIAGVGPALAAARTAAALHSGAYRLVISAGIAGGFPGRAPVGTIALANEIVAADLGVETGNGFSSLDELGFGSARVHVNSDEAARLADALRTAGLRTAVGPVLTVSTATGTAATAEALAARIPGAVAEAMEGYGVAVAAQEFGLPVLELRAISNAVGPRDRAAWRIGEALQALQAASKVAAEVFK